MKKTLFYKIGLFTFIFGAIVLISKNSVFAEEAPLKDSDLDGIPDQVEINTYNTNPLLEDTDGDGVLDYQEIIDGTNPTDPNSSKLLDAKQAENSIFGLTGGIPIMWYVGRIAGISSFVMFTIVICFGLLMTSKFLLKYRVMFPGEAQEAHMFIATFIAFVLLLVHIFAFIFDDYIKLKVPEIFVPFLLKRDLLSSSGFNIGIPVALGVIALYLAVVLLLTSHLRNKIFSNKTWRKIHYSSFLFYILFLVHAYTAGSDSQEGWMIAIYVTSLVLVVGLILMRIFGKKFFLPKPKPKSAVATVATETSN